MKQTNVFIFFEYRIFSTWRKIVECSAVSIVQVTTAIYSANPLIYWKLEYSFDMAISHIVYVTNDEKKM